MEQAQDKISSELDTKAKVEVPALQRSAEKTKEDNEVPEAAQKSVQQDKPESTTKQSKAAGTSPVKKKTTFPSKFQLASDLSNGQISLVTNEAIVESWIFESTSMSIAEWFATFISFGIYYFMTRIVLQRKRFYKVFVTNMNIIVKEEMTETSWGCLKLLLENQASFPISSLAFVTAEVIGQKMCGCIPASVVLEMRFGRYPVDSEYPITVYRY